MSSETEDVARKLKSLEQERTSVLCGTHADFLSQRQEFVNERTSRVAEADSERKLCIDQINALFNYRLKAMDDVLRGKEAALKEKIIAQIDAKIKHIQNTGSINGLHEINGNSSNAANDRIGTRFLRSLQAKNDTENDSIAATAIPATGESTGEISKFSISEEDALSDLRQLHSMIVASQFHHNAENQETNSDSNRMEADNGAELENTNESECKLEKRKIVLPGNVEIPEGEAIRIIKMTYLMSNELIDGADGNEDNDSMHRKRRAFEEYNLVGELTSIEPEEDEITVQLLQGMLLRIPLDQIRTGRIILKKYSISDEMDIINERERHADLAETIDNNEAYDADDTNLNSGHVISSASDNPTQAFAEIATSNGNLPMKSE